MALANRLRLLAAGLTVLAVLLAATPAAAVIGGHYDDRAHPSVGMVAVVTSKGAAPLCTGVLVAPRVILTAGHCTAAMEELNASALVSFEPNPVTSSLQIRPRFALGTPITDQRYTGRGLDRHDFGVILVTAWCQVSPPIPSIRCRNTPVPIAPAILPAAGLLDEMRADGTLRSQSFVAVGYGAVTRIHEFELPADEPGDDGTHGPWEFVSDLRRNSGTSSFMALNPEILRLSGNESLGDAGACHGDSGGPYFLAGSDLAVAMVKTGDHVCRAMVAALRLDTPAAREFISSLGVTVP